MKIDVNIKVTRNQHDVAAVVVVLRFLSPLPTCTMRYVQPFPHLKQSLKGCAGILPHGRTSNMFCAKAPGCAVQDSALVWR